MESNLDKDKAKLRKAELLDTFERMTEYAAKNGICAILIAGDMFDTANISATARNAVTGCIARYSDINFYYLKGNHDNDNFLSDMDEKPENLLMFNEKWTSYSEADGKVVIAGLELNSDNSGSAYTSLLLNPDKFNIVMLHGQEAESTSKDKAEIINLKELKNKGIDYRALGHIHAYREEKLDARGVYCYSGCLEGRGFDECGEHGFIVIDIDEDKGSCTREFVPFAKRTLYTVNADVTGCQTTAEMAGRVEEELERMHCGKESLIKIVLQGMVDVECEKDTAYIKTRFASEYFFVKVYDETRLKVNIEDYMYDQSLKGEFVRQVMSDASLSDDDKSTVVRYGLQAIAGEEVC
jgi:DNA repair exonuclease SbcCD nuclease subunit